MVDKIVDFDSVTAKKKSYYSQHGFRKLMQKRDGHVMLQCEYRQQSFAQ